MIISITYPCLHHSFTLPYFLISPHCVWQQTQWLLVATPPRYFVVHAWFTFYSIMNECCNCQDDSGDLGQDHTSIPCWLDSTWFHIDYQQFTKKKWWGYAVKSPPPPFLPNLFLELYWVELAWQSRIIPCLLYCLSIILSCNHFQSINLCNLPFFLCSQRLSSLANVPSIISRMRFDLDGVDIFSYDCIYLEQHQYIPLLK